MMFRAGTEVFKVKDFPIRKFGEDYLQQQKTKHLSILICHIHFHFTKYIRRKGKNNLLEEESEISSKKTKQSLST